jgi:hypothetical protein
MVVGREISSKDVMRDHFSECGVKAKSGENEEVV